MLIHSEVVSFFTNISRNRRRGAVRIPSLSIFEEKGFSRKFRIFVVFLENFEIS
ncbi:hypothetical protein T4B_11264 [Trichinella pseudospiralis]|uniref:Uncharacterized protein n=1 Tax=Trichinella pseudospiralis TaxID=6337 RepID=A0A0V1GG72_TRIPS|nr:hypothetical protein T4B_11264 [Trichinella pseudospiralis]